MTTTQLTELFTGLRAQLVPLVDSLRTQPESPNVLEGNFDTGKQRTFAESVVSAIGFDFVGGRFDLAQHPFCTQLGPGDVRIGTRYYENNVSRGIFTGLPIMLPAIHFDNELGASRNEVADEWADRNLAIETNSRDFSRA